MTEQEADNMIRECLWQSAPRGRRLVTISSLVGLDRARTGQSLMRLMQHGHVIYNGRGAYCAVR